MSEFDPSTGEFKIRSRVPGVMSTIPGMIGFLGADLAASAMSRRGFVDHLVRQQVRRGVPAAAASALAEAAVTSGARTGRIIGSVSPVYGTAVGREIMINRQLRNAGIGRVGVARAQLARGLKSVSRGFNFALMIELGVTLGRTVADIVGSYTPEKKPWRRRQLETGVPYLDTRISQTQRQRAIQAIHNSQMTTRAILGNEAAFAHRMSM